MRRGAAGGGDVARLIPPDGEHGDLILTLPEFFAFGEALGRRASVSVPCVVTLTGDLGAGKTTLTRAIGRGFGIGEPVTSPTFSLVHEYRAERGEFFHLDLYRISGPHELANIGWDEMFHERGLVVIEWPDRAGSLIPSDALAITLTHIDGDESRRRVQW